MGTRSAEHSIEGYLYQFLYTIYDILNQPDDSSLNQIEGIEDLDIFSSDNGKVELCQYKYHETKTFTNSVIAKPVGIMFNHFLFNQSSEYTYKLIVHTNNDAPSIDETLVRKVLELKGAKDHIDKEHQQYCYDVEKIKQFKDKFIYISAKKLIELEEETIKKIIDVFGVSQEEAHFNILPNALKKVNSIGTNSREVDRVISTKDFKNLLIRQKHIADVSFIARIHGEQKAIKELIKRLNRLHIKPNRSEFVVFIKNHGRFDLASLIIELSQKFYYKGNKTDLKPITFIVEDLNGLENLKKEIISTMKRNNCPMIFNDGFEDYGFSSEIFNMTAISTHHARKIDNVNFNFRLLSYQNFRINKDNITFKNPTVFCIAKYEEEVFQEFDKVFFVKALEKDNILTLLGGR